MASDPTTLPTGRHGSVIAPPEPVQQGVRAAFGGLGLSLPGLPNVATAQQWKTPA
jgi:hypothetical protein